MSELRATSAPTLAEFLLPEAARAFGDDAWVFTGFNWPVLAAAIAWRLGGRSFVQVLEGGAALDREPQTLPTSTTDYHAFDRAVCFRGSTGDVLLSVVPRCEIVMIDAANVDVQGRTNTTAIGPLRAPRVRLPGGGGGPDAAARAAELVLLHGGDDPDRLQGAVEHVTVRPNPAATVRLLTRWGEVALGTRPRLVSRVEHPGTDRFVRRLVTLGVDVDQAATAPRPSAEERSRTREVLVEAAARGYRNAVAALAELDAPAP